MTTMGQLTMNDREQASRMPLLMRTDARNYDPAGTHGERTAARGILVKDGRVAMLHCQATNAYTHGCGYYTFPGGGVEADETEQDALIRELREECGLVVKRQSIRPFGSTIRIQKGLYEEVFTQKDAFYLCEAAEQRVETNRQPYEIAARMTLEFVSPEEAKRVNEQVDCADRTFLRDFLAVTNHILCLICPPLLFEISPMGNVAETPAIVRHSARGIMMRNGKIAMIHSGKYHYFKFPGGGMEAGESPIDALIRETMEEAGLTVLPESILAYGLVHRVSPSREGGRFVQDNYYYLCQAEEQTAPQCLDPYEAEEAFALRWLTLREALQINRQVENSPGFANDPMLERECRVLEMLIKATEEGKIPG